MIRALPLLLLAACSNELPFHYQVECLGPIESTVPLDVASVERALQAGFRRLDVHGLMSEPEACAFFSLTRVWYYGAGAVEVPEHRGWEAETDIHGVHLSRGGRELLHELLHIVDVERFGNVFSPWHWRWADNGLNAVDGFTPPWKESTP